MSAIEQLQGILLGMIRLAFVVAFVFQIPFALNLFVTLSASFDFEAGVVVLVAVWCCLLSVYALFVFSVVVAFDYSLRLRRVFHDCRDPGLPMEFLLRLSWVHVLVPVVFAWLVSFNLNRIVLFFSRLLLYSLRDFHATMCINLFDVCACFCCCVTGCVTIARSLFLMTVFLRLSVSSFIVCGE